MFVAVVVLRGLRPVCRLVFLGVVPVYRLFKYSKHWSRDTRAFLLGYFPSPICLWLLGTYRASRMVDDADFESAVWAGGRNPVFPNESCDHAPLGHSSLRWDMADPWLAMAVLGRTLHGAGKGIFVAVVGSCEFWDVITLAVDFVGHGMFTDTAAFGFRKRTTIGKHFLPTGHLGLPDVIRNVGKFLPIEFKDRYSGSLRSFRGTLTLTF